MVRIRQDKLLYSFASFLAGWLHAVSAHASLFRGACGGQKNVAHTTRFPMYRKIFFLVVVIGGLLAMMPAAYATVAYTVTDITPLGGIANSYPRGINAKGEVVGTYSSIQNSYYRHGFLYSLSGNNWVTSDFGTLGGNTSIAAGINDGGSIVGVSELDTINNVLHALVIHNGVMKDLGNFGAYSSNASSSATGINNNGQIVGVATSSNLNEPGIYGFVTNGGVVTSLGLNVNPQDINDKGQIIGSYNGQAFVTNNGVMTYLSTLGGTSSKTYAINNNGQVVGLSDTGGSYTDSFGSHQIFHAFVTNGGVMTDLGTLSGDVGSGALDINNNGQIVGYSSGTSGARAFVTVNGVMTDLNTLIDANSGWILEMATAINYNGQITATGWKSLRTFLLTPISSSTPTVSPKNLGDCGCTAEANPINSAIGNKYQHEVDTEFPAHTGLTLDRYYNSLDSTKTTYGVGWRSNWHRGIQVAADGLSAKFTREDGRVYTFTKSGAAWVADADVTTQLASVTGGYQIIRDNSDIELYDANGKLQSVTTPNGLVTTITYWPVSGLLHTVTGPYGHKFEFQYLADTYIGSVILPDGKALSYAYNAAGNLTGAHHADSSVRTYVYENTSFPNALTGIVDENGKRFATWGYDVNGKANLSTHAGNAEKTALVYNADGSTTVTDARNKSHTNSFSTVQGVLKLATESGTANPNAGAKAYTYDAAGFVESSTDWRNVVTKYTHDARGNETSRTEASGTALARTITTTWHPQYNVPMTVSEPTRITSFTRDAAGNMLTRTIKDKASSATRVWTYTYGATGGGKGQVTSIDGPRTDVVDKALFEYDAGGGLSKITDALGHVTTLVNDVNGRPVTITDPNGLVTSVVYDPLGRVSLVAEGQEVTSYLRDAVGNVTQVTLPPGTKLTYLYDAAHRLIRVTDALGNNIRYALDGMGNRIKVAVYDNTGTLVHMQARAFDAVNRLVTLQGALAGEITTLSRDANGNVTKVTDANNHATATTYDALNRPGISKDAAGGLTTSFWNAADELKEVDDPNGHATVIVRNGFGEATKITSPDSGITTYARDSAGNALTKTDARGQKLTYTYDALNRQTSECDATNVCVKTTWDSVANGSSYGIGHVVRDVYQGGATDFSYTINGHLAQQKQTITYNTYTLTQTWDAVKGRITKRTYPSGMVVGYGYNVTNQVNVLTVNGTPLLTNVVYQPFTDQAKSWAWGVGTTAKAYTRTFDLDGRVTTLPLDSTGLVRTILRDPAGLIAGLSDSVVATLAQSQVYQYDVLDRLMHYSNGSVVEDYTYDLNGNRITGPLTGNGASYDPLSDKMASIWQTASAPAPVTQDAAGNVIKDGLGDTFSYTARGRMGTASHNAATATRYGYNGSLGEPALRLTPAGNTPVLIADPDHRPIGEYNVASVAAGITKTLVQETIYLGDLPVGMTKVGGTTATATQVYRTYAGHLNEPHALTAATGATKVWTWDPTPFGNTAPTGSVAYNFRFPGQVYDAYSGLNLNVYRAYNPATGRYTQADPIGLAGGQMNLYVYVGGNPVSYIDRIGNFGDYVDSSGVPHITIHSPNRSTIETSSAYKFYSWCRSHQNCDAILSKEPSSYIRAVTDWSIGEIIGHAESEILTEKGAYVLDTTIDVSKLVTQNPQNYANIIQCDRDRKSGKVLSEEEIESRVIPLSYPEDHELSYVQRNWQCMIGDKKYCN